MGSLAYAVRVRKECVEGGVPGAEEQGVRRGEHDWVVVEDESTTGWMAQEVGDVEGAG